MSSLIQQKTPPENVQLAATQVLCVRVDDFEEAWCLRDNEPARARALAEEALNLTDEPHKAQGLTVLSFLHFREDRFDTSLEQAFEALILFGNEPQPWLARLLNTLALNFIVLGERAQSLEYLLEQLRVSQKLGFEEGIFGAYHDLGLWYSHSDNAERALGYFERAEAYVGHSADRRAFLFLNLACHYMTENQLGKAREYAEQALRLSRSEALTRAESFSLEVLAQLALAENNDQEGLELYQNVMRLKLQHGGLCGPTWLSIADVYTKQGEFTKASSYLHKALAELETSGDKVNLMSCHTLLYEVAKGQGDVATALRHHEQMHRLSQEIFSDENEVKIRALDVVHRTDALKRESELLAQKNEQLERQYQELETLHEKVHELSIRDGLTGLYNRRYLFEQADRLLNHSRRYERPLSVAMLDIDHFKIINDTFGHKLGDDVLHKLAHLLTETLREADPIARYGGEEFALIMLDTSTKNARLACERVRSAISSFDWATLQAGLEVTVSIGLVTHAEAETSEALFSLADKQLYEAKRKGRNRVCADFK